MTNDYNLRIRKIAVIENGGRKTSDVLKACGCRIKSSRSRQTTDLESCQVFLTSRPMLL